MSRIATALPVPPKMYRHFAAITILLTLCIAIFADGERRQAINDEIDSQKQQIAMRQAEGEQRKAGQPVAAVKYYHGGGGGDGGGGGMDPAPMVNPEGAGQSIGSGDGSYRSADLSDLGRFGPPGLQQVVSGQKSGETTVLPTRLSKSARSSGPTPEQRAALERAGSTSAGAPTQPHP